jgi:translation elongation factor EF-Tu-like GTPase
MTKQRRTIGISAELDGVIGLLAARKKMNYSEYVESRLKLVPEILNELQRLQSMPDDASPIIKGSLKDALKATDEIEAEQKNLVA